MQFHYEKTLEQSFKGAAQIVDDSPAWLTVCLTRALKEWFGQSCRGLCRSGNNQLQFGYNVLSVPVLEFAQAFGPLICRVNRVWPVQVFGMADSGEMIQLSFAEEDDKFSVRQHNISGIWWENLQDIYFCICLPDLKVTDCMLTLLCAAAQDDAVVAMDWHYADFLEEQKLSKVDHTKSFCYVPLDGNETERDPLACLAGLQLNHKEALWRLFLEKQLPPPEFEWLRNALLKDCAPNWIEWHLALYRTLEQLGIQFLCSGGQFELMDRTGQRLYFGVDHTSAAEYVLMKILFPLNQS